MPQSEKQKEWILNNPEKIKLYQKAYQQKHAEQLSIARSIRYFKYKSYHQQLAKDYYTKHKAAIKAQKRQYYLDNKEVIKAHQTARYYKNKYKQLQEETKQGDIMKYVESDEVK